MQRPLGSHRQLLRLGTIALLQSYNDAWLHEQVRWSTYVCARHFVYKQSEIPLQLPSFSTLTLQVCLVGFRQFNTFGSHGAADFVPMRSFDSLTQCCEHLKEVEGIVCNLTSVEASQLSHGSKCKLF